MIIVCVCVGRENFEKKTKMTTGGGGLDSIERTSHVAPHGLWYITIIELGRCHH